MKKNNAPIQSSYPAQIDPNVVAIVVTYNRKLLLQQCLRNLLDQTQPCDIAIVDNASSDGTQAMLKASSLLDHPRIHYLRIEENKGGAGGFQRGLSFAMSKKWQWFWLMDDDALPDSDALKNLLKYATNSQNVYGSVAFDQNNGCGQTTLSWPAQLLRNGELINQIASLSEVEAVYSIPFLGFFVHRGLIEEIGLPDGDFFINADDLEYSLRARNYGAKLLLVKSSRIQHPIAKIITFQFGKFRLVYRVLPTWKMYYEVRNKITIGKRYFGWQVWTKTIPGLILRAALSLLVENRRRQVLMMYGLGMRDGITGRMGQRILP